MDSGTGRKRFNPKKPGPTLFEASERVIRLIVIVAALHFFLAGLNNGWTGWRMMGVWFAAGSFVIFATYRIERYLLRRGRFGP